MLRRWSQHDLNCIEAWERKNGPVGEWREDLRMGILASITAAPHMGKGKSASPADFMPFEEKPQQTMEEMLGVMSRAAKG